MSEAEKIALIQSLVTDVVVTTEQATEYLSLSSDWVVRNVWPFGNAPETLPPQYDLIQCQKAVRMINKSGAEGLTSHSENGISWNWGNQEDVDLLNSLVPHVGVL